MEKSVRQASRLAPLLLLCCAARGADLVDLARSAAPEFFADLAIQKAQIPLLEEAMTAASHAQEPVRVVAIFGTPMESRAMYRSKASELGRDALTLQTRIVKAMLPLNAAKARDLFKSITLPASGARPCNDPLLIDTADYYETAATLAPKDIQFIQSVLAGVQGPNELAAFVHAFQSADLKPDEWKLLLATLATKLETVNADYRQFALSLNGLRADIERLARRGPADDLVLSFRTYLVAQLRAPRCAEDLVETTPIVEWFNSSFRGNLPAINEAETKPSARDSAIKADPYFEAEDSRGLGQILTRLQFNSDGKPRSSADRTTGEWRKLQADFLRDLEAWEPAGTAADVLHQKAYVYRAVLALTPPGDDRERLIDTFVAFLRSSPAEKLSPAEWLWQVRALIQAARGDEPKLFQEFRNSGDAGLLLAIPGVTASTTR